MNAPWRALGRIFRVSMASLALIHGVAAQSPLPLNVDVNSLIGRIEPRFVSFGWEMWGMMGYLPVMNDARYVRAASALAPAVVRVGGITADWVRYDLSTAVPARVDPLAARTFLGDWPTEDHNLTISAFETLLNFTHNAGLDLLFDLNELYGRNCSGTAPPGRNQAAAPGVWCSGPWDTSNVRAFLQYLHDRDMVGGGSSLFAFELGNELASHLDPIANTQDIVTLAGIIREVWADVPAAQVPPLYAPSTDACWDNATFAIMRNITGVAAGFTYHAYPAGGGVTPSLQQLLLNATWLREGIMAGSKSQACIDAWNAGPRQAGLQLWVTEASSSYNWSLPAPAQDSFLHGFFTLPQYGQYAEAGVGIVARWSLSEQSPFGTIKQNSSRPGPAGGWDVAADYFFIVLHKRLLGSGVLAVTGDEGSGVLAYAACSQHGNGSIVLVAVNPSNEAVTLSLQSQAQPSGLLRRSGASTRASPADSASLLPAAPRQEYVLTAPGGDLSSHTPVLNGNASAPLRIGEDGSAPPMQPRYVAPGGAGADVLTLPPQSQAFFVLLEAGAPACT